jgi:hypothetical protein
MEGGTQRQAQWQQVRSHLLARGPSGLIIFGHVWILSAIAGGVLSGRYGSCKKHKDEDGGENHCGGLQWWRVFFFCLAFLFFGLFIAQIYVNVFARHWSQLPQESGVYVYDDDEEEQDDYA